MLAPVFESLGRRVAHHPRLTILVWVVLTALGLGLAVFGVHGESLFDRLATGAPAVPGSQSAEADDILAEADGAETPAELVLRVDTAHDELDAFAGQQPADGVEDLAG